MRWLNRRNRPDSGPAIRPNQTDSRAPPLPGVLGNVLVLLEPIFPNRITSFVAGRGSPVTEPHPGIRPFPSGEPGSSGGPAPRSALGITTGSSMHIWTHPVLQDTVSIATRKRLLPYIRPIDADLLPLALMNSARLDLNRRSASNKATASIRFSRRRSDLSRHQSLLCPRNLLTGFRVHYWIFKPIL